MRLDGEPWAQPIPAKGAPEGPLKVMSILAFMNIVQQSSLLPYVVMLQLITLEPYHN